MKSTFTLAFLLFFSFLSAQNTSTANNLEKLVKLDLGLRGVGITYEPKLSNKMSIELSGGIGGGYDISFQEFTYSWNLLDPALYVVVNPKYYYNRNKKQAKGKTTALNSGNYIGLGIKYTSRGITENTDVWDALLFNLHWGMQRAIGKGWTFNTHAGVGYAIDATDLSNSSGTIYPALDLRFGYVLNKRKIKN
jgi:hypothetical protein